MSLGLDNPGLLPLSLLTGLPLLIHLIARPRPKRFRFPSLMLLTPAHRETVRMRRPRHWLLLLLRTLWMGLMVSVFLQPRWYAETPEAETAGTRSLVVVLDATASLRAREGAQSRYALAVSEAVSLLRQLDSGDRANVIRARAVPESFYPEPGVNRDFLIEELRRRPCSREGGSLEDALRLAVRQLGRLEGDREIVVISDFQPDAAGLATRLEAPSDLKLRVLGVAGEEVPNQAVVRLDVLPARPVSGQPFQVSAEIRNFSGQPLRRSLSLRLGDRYEQMMVELPARESARAEFTLSMETEEPVTLTAELEDDAFPDDNARHRVLHFRPALRVGVWGQDTTARWWMRTLRALPGVQVAEVEDPEILPADLDALLLSGWRGEGFAAVRAFAERGNSLLFFPQRISPELADWLQIPAGPLDRSAVDPPLGLRVPDPWPETLRLFRDGEFGSPARALLRRHAFFPLSDERLDPILSLETGETVWGRFAHLPSVFYWNLSLDPADSDLVAQLEWVPLFGEWLRHAFQADPLSSVPAGDLAPLAGEALESEKPTLFRLDGESLPTRSGDGFWFSEEPLAPGLYFWRGGKHQLLSARAVHLPAAESDLRPLEPETTAGDPLPSLSRADHWRGAREGRALWPWLLAMAFIAAALEHAICHREDRT